MDHPEHLKPEQSAYVGKRRPVQMKIRCWIVITPLKHMIQLTVILFLDISLSEKNAYYVLNFKFI